MDGRFASIVLMSASKFSSVPKQSHPPRVHEAREFVEIFSPFSQIPTASIACIKMETLKNELSEETSLLNQYDLKGETLEETPLLNQVELTRILIATEYLPPFVSGISNRCKNLIKGYRERGHTVTVLSHKGTDCDYPVLSIPNPLYNAQRMFIFPPLWLLFALLNPWAVIPWDVVHLFGLYLCFLIFQGPLCLPFIPLLPLFRLRGVSVYVSYHVYLEAYKEVYFASYPAWIANTCEWLFIYLYFLPYVSFANVVGVPSKVADYCVYQYALLLNF